MTGARPEAREEGAALLAVLLLVVVIAALAALGTERLALSRRAAVNALEVEQARFHAEGAAALALLVIDDLGGRDGRLPPGWQGVVRQYRLPDGADARLSVGDGGNCFNLNALVAGDPPFALARRPEGERQFAALLRFAGADPALAAHIASAAADWADVDDRPGPAGAEDETYRAADPPYRAPNALFSDAGELRHVAGMNAALLARVRPFLCALPLAGASPVNVNSLSPDQAVLLAALAGGDVPAARRAIARRPAQGWDSAAAFRRSAGLGEGGDIDTATRFFRLDIRIEAGESLYTESLLVDARLQPARIVARRRGW